MKRKRFFVWLFFILSFSILLLSFGLGRKLMFSQKNFKKGVSQETQEILYKGIKYFRDKEYDKAIAQFKKIIKNHPDASSVADAWDYIARIYELREDYISAINAYKKAGQREAEILNVYLKLLKQYDEKGDIERIIDVSEKAKRLLTKLPTRKRKDCAEAANEFAWRLKNRGEHKRAFDFYLISADIYAVIPDSDEIFISSIKKAAMIAKERLKKDEELYRIIGEKIIAHKFRDSDLLTKAGYELVENDLYPLARIYYKKALDLGRRYGVLKEHSFLWEFPLLNLTNNNARLADLNGDNQLEVIACSDEVFCLQGKDGEVIWHYPTSGFVYKAPLLADFDGDSMLDVVVTSGDFVWALRGYDGKLLWKFGEGKIADTPFEAEHFNSVLFIGNSRSSKINNVFFQNSNGIYCLEGGNGRIIWNIKKGRSLTVPQAMADFNQDGVDDMVAIDYRIQRPVRIFVYAGEDGGVLFQWESEERNDGIEIDKLIVSDVSEDGTPNIIAFSKWGNMWAMNIKREKLWNTALYAVPSGKENLGEWKVKDALAIDLDSDSQNEIIIFTYRRVIYIVDSKTGKLRSEFHKRIYDLALWDYNQDEYLDLVDVDNNRLNVLSLKDKKLLLGDFSRTYISCDNPILGDIDNDGKVEIIAIGSYGFLTAFKTNKDCEKGAIIWPRQKQVNIGKEEKG